MDQSKRYRGHHVALIVPCFNEEAAIGAVLAAFHRAMPQLDLYVFDNRSTDATVVRAKAAGATVVSVALRGKGNVVRRMFADVEADVYVMVDGDSTYDASSLPALVDTLLDDHLDMVVGCRTTGAGADQDTYRPGHRWGNRLLTWSVVRLFGGSFTDLLSGYRVFSRRYVKSFPALSHGFEIETELTVHALELRMPWGEIATPYGSRPAASHSKLSTYQDGWRILRTIAKLYISERPLAFFALCAALLAATAVLLALPLLFEYLRTGLVPRLPTAVLAASMGVSALLSLVCGLILDTVTRGRQEAKRFVYLATPPSAHQDR